jgi:iron complex outermembrane recepter protein
MFKRTELSRSVLLAFTGAVASLSGGTVFAQAAPTQQLQRVEITGSNIRRTDTETASPVQTVTREDIEKSGKSTVAEFLQTLAVDNQGSVPMTYGRGFAGSSGSGISLRGLGAQSTLVLVNGRRVAPHGLADDGQKAFVDLNMIPAEAVERVEILKDGASAIYGSDAIAGVVNVILRKSYVGTVAKASYGISEYNDGANPRVSISHGFGDIDKDQYNVLLNLELAKKNAIYGRDRSDRGRVGRSEGRSIGFAPSSIIAGVAAGGNGFIPTNPDGTLVNNSANSSIVGNVRDPDTLNYYARSNPNGAGFTQTFPASICGALTNNFPQGDPGGGCVFDAWQRYGQVQPDSKSANFFGRFTKQINADTEAFAELNYYSTKASIVRPPIAPSGTILYPGGVVTSSNIALGATHPDNPYFGQAARLRYLATDVGPLVTNSKTDFSRFVAGLKGRFDAWDYDTALSYSQSKTHQVQTGTIDRLVAYALLNPTATNVAAATASSAAYAALPAGTVWRIAENAGLNSAAMYNALSPEITRDGIGKNVMLDFKASREIGQLDGGPIGVALGAEVRRESLSLSPYTNFLLGNTIGAGYSIYDGSRSVAAAYVEGLFPVLKGLELSAALRGDRYSDAGNSVTPKVGVKWTPVSNVALRGTYAQGFRAPNAPENGPTAGLAAGSSGTSDPVRCALGVPGTCDVGGAAALLAAGNPDLKPEKSKSLSLGVVWDVMPGTSFTADLWEIRRTGEIITENLQAAVNAGRVIRDPNTSTGAGDPGAITAILVNYINAAKTTVRGLDLDAKTRFDLGGSGKLSLNANWTHLFTWKRQDPDGTEYEYAGTHGNCDVTNCMGTPADRINLGATWELGAWRWSAIANYRASISNKLFKDDPAGCANSLANGEDSPSGCKVASFKTIDLSARWQVSPSIEVTGSIQNLFDRAPPFDPLTYGAIGYNPLDYSGAIGRFYNVGMRYKF